MQQRKKDNNDPIVNPTYFIKPAEELKGITIDGFTRKIVSKNRPKSGINVKTGDNFYSGKKTVQRLRPQSGKITSTVHEANKSFGSSALRPK